MAFPLKFKPLLELELHDVERPDYVWLAYAVCGCELDACGWNGWIISAAFQRTDEIYPSKPGHKLLPSQGNHCPRCGRVLFETAAQLRFEPSADQEPIPYRGGETEEKPMEYE